MKCYSNPKYIEYMKDDIFVKNIIKERKSQERKDAIKAVAGIAIAAAVFISSWLAIIVLEG